MSEDKIPTAEEYIKLYGKAKFSDDGKRIININLSELLRGFAKMHVVECEKAHRENFEQRGTASCIMHPNIYPLENIK